MTKPAPTDKFAAMTSFPITVSAPIEHSSLLPKQCDVVVIGGGIIGVMTAWYLAKSGQKVVLCEKGRIAAEQSSRNWGWIRQQGRDPAELPIMIEANRIWQTLEAECGEDLGFRQVGVLYLANTQKDMFDYEAWLKHAQSHQLDSRILSRSGVVNLIPSIHGNWKGGLYTKSDARAEPSIAVRALARAVARAGVTIVENCAVRTLDLQDKKVSGVVTENGRIACAQVVVAGGAWSSLFLRNHGVSIPQLSVQATVAATTALPEVFGGGAVDNNFAFRRRADGGYTLALGSRHDFYIGPDAFRHFANYLPQLKKSPFASTYHINAPRHFPDAWQQQRAWNGEDVSPFEHMRVLNPAANSKHVDLMCDHFAKAFPRIGRPQIKTAWAGMIDTMPDVVPMIDHAPAIAGLTIATGLSGHGFGIGPAVGRVVADLVMGKTTGHDLKRFRFSRFSDGSKIEMGPSL